LLLGPSQIPFPLLPPFNTYFMLTAELDKYLDASFFLRKSVNPRHRNASKASATSTLINCVMMHSRPFITYYPRQHLELFGRVLVCRLVFQQLL